MTTPARFSLLLLLIISLGASAGCGSKAPVTSEIIPPKPRTETTTNPYQNFSDSDALYGEGMQPTDMENEAADFRQDDWTYEEKAAASVITNAVIYFYFDSFTLTSEAQVVLKQKAQKIKEFPQFMVVIAGHCDERGTDEYNIALGERRARAAFDFLVQSGVPVRQIEMISYGKLHPAAHGVGEAVWSKNRRAEFKVTKKPR